ARGPYRDTVLFNAGAALVVAGYAQSVRDGTERAGAAVDGGAALAALEALRRESRLAGAS
ncbi:MAG: anthranilate phosphoribosyltransferase, partial [Acetobacteraceae bacterium]